MTVEFHETSIRMVTLEITEDEARVLLDPDEAAQSGIVDATRSAIVDRASALIQSQPWEWVGSECLDADGNELFSID